MSEVRLIDANALLKRVKSVVIFGYSYFISAIENAPTVDPVRHGHWENVSRILEVQTEGGFFQGQCSECHRYSYQPIGWGGHMDLEYCSGCGAKMDEKGESQ